MTKRSSRERTGTIEKWIDADGKHRYRARIRLADGSRPRYPVPEGFSEARAREFAAAMQEREDAQGLLYAKKLREAGTPTPKETVTEYSVRWLAHRDRLGHTSVRDDKSRLDHHVLPHLGSLPMASFTKADVEAVRDVLDAKVRAGSLKWKTALNTWGLVTKLCSDAASSKERALRVRDDNPAAGVLATDRGVETSKQFLYPSELATFIACEAVPREWRELLAVAIYLGLRAGELEALRWEDVDLDRGIVNVHRAIDRSRGVVKETKTGRPRRFTIEPAARELLEAMHERSDSERVIADMPGIQNLAIGLRRYLKKAGIDRAELHETTATRQALRFHDLRATHCTWSAIRGDEPLRIQQRAGHTDFATTSIYVRQAEMLREGFEQVFGSLGALLVDHQPVHFFNVAAESSCEGRELNPYRCYPART